jgi:SSS family solute:Na+ symporter
MSGRWPSIGGIDTTFFFSRLWRRAHVMTDAEVVKYRYGGKLGNALRVFKGVYFGVIINCFVLGAGIALVLVRRIQTEPHPPSAR